MKFVDAAGAGQLLDVVGDAVEQRGHSGQVDGNVRAVWPILTRPQIHRWRIPAGGQLTEPLAGLPQPGCLVIEAVTDQVAAASLRIEIPASRADASAQSRSRSALCRRHAARATRVSTRRSRRHVSMRSLTATPPVSTVFRKLNDLSVLVVRLLPTPHVRQR